MEEFKFIKNPRKTTNSEITDYKEELGRHFALFATAIKKNGGDVTHDHLTGFAAGIGCGLFSSIPKNIKNEELAEIVKDAFISAQPLINNEENNDENDNDDEDEEDEDEDEDN
jgi:hypothetical protein